MKSITTIFSFLKFSINHFSTNRKIKSLKLTYALSCFLAILSMSNLNATDISGTYSSDVTLDLAGSPYVLTGDVLVDVGVTMTIEPGVEIQFPTTNNDFEIYGTLDAIGTSGNHILLTSSNANGGGSLVIRENATANLEFMDLENLGFTTLSFFRTGLYIYDATVAADNLTFTNCGLDGGTIHIIADANAMGGFGSNNLIEKVRFIANSLNISAIWPNIDATGFTYILQGDQFVAVGNTLTINPGVTVNFSDPNSDIEIYGDLIAIGEPSSHILLTSDHVNGGGAIALRDLSSSTLGYVDFENLGTTTLSFFRTGLQIYDASVVADNLAFTNCGGQGGTISMVANAQTLSNFGPNNSVDQVQLINNSLHATATWPKLDPGDFNYYLSGDQFVDLGTILTIEAGVEINLSNTNTDIEVNGTLNALGTTGNHLKIYSTHSNGGGSLAFRDGSVGDLLYIDFEDLGNTTLSFFRSGLYIYDAQVSADFMTYLNCGVGDVSIDAMPHVIDNIGANNSVDEVRIRGGFISKNSVWPLMDVGGFNYIMSSDIFVGAGFELTIEPGVQINLSTPNIDLEIFGTLNAISSEINPIRLYTTHGNGGGSLTFHNNSIGTLGHVVFEDLGRTTLSFWRAGLYLNDTDVTADNLTFINSGVNGQSITTNPYSLDNFGNDNQVDQVKLINQVITKNSIWPDLDPSGFNYFLAGDLVVTAGFALTIEPGVDIDFPATGSDLEIFGTLIANGTAEDSVKFYSSHGNGGGSIVLHASSVGNQISYARISELGKTNLSFYRAALYLYNGDLTIEKSTIKNSLRGFTIENGQPTINANIIKDNSILGINNISINDIVDACDNYWGDPTGPFNATNNPGGLGNGVTDNVLAVDCAADALEIICPNDTALFVTDNYLTDNIGSVEVCIQDCYGELTIDITDSEADPQCTFDMIRSFAVSDTCGNMKTCDQTISFTDNVDPTIDCPANETLDCNASVPSVDLGLITANDNCEVETLMLDSEIENIVDCVHTYTRTFTATDPTGNSANCSYDISVKIDLDAPVLSEMPGNVTVSCTDYPVVPAVTAMDNCDGAVAVVFSEDASEDPCNISLVRTWTATDECGNVASHTQIISGDRGEIAMTGVPSDVTVECSTLPISEPTITATDNCGSVDVTLDEIVVGTTCNGTITRTWTANSGCDIVSGTQVITVIKSGCMDVAACNYDVEVTNDDASCVYAEGCDVCDGVGGVTDNPEVGDSCDDGDAGTVNDIVISDCTCLGTPSGDLENTALACSDGLDNDGDNLIDCEDEDCQALNDNLGCETCFGDGLSFADSVIEYFNACSGSNVATDPSVALGTPDYEGGGDDVLKFVSLGNGGFVKLEFTNNSLTNSGDEGPDLFVFEIGPQVESSTIELRPSNSDTEDILILNGIVDVDLDGFYEFGAIGGSTASIDIDALIPGLLANTIIFDAIKIMDLPDSNCSGSTPGADIDAVCALSSVPCVVGASCDDGDPLTTNEVLQPDCSCSLSPENNAIDCSDGIDNDMNGLTDCEDPGCTGLGNNAGCSTCFEDGLSFADTMLEYFNNCPNNLNTNPLKALGVPDDGLPGNRSVSLGDGGFIRLGFDNNTLTNSGDAEADLFVFEIGPAVESSIIELRPINMETENILINAGILDTDLDGFYEFGTIGGSTAAVDLDAIVVGLPVNSIFFDAIKITDEPGDNCADPTPGADIDAVCALSSIPCIVGELCDDGNPISFDDQIQADCTCQGTILGCVDMEACNYDDTATDDDGNCIYALGCDECDGAGGVTNNPEIGDVCDDGNPETVDDVYTSCGVCGGTVVPGCVDDTACNFDDAATVDDETCIYAEGCDVCDGVGGVTDNPEVGDACDDFDDTTINDVYTSCGVCEGETVPGCMDDTACNFDDAATVDDETCIYAEGCDVCDGVGGITDNPEVGDACDDFDVTTINDVYTSCDVCEGETVPGCMDNTACNYDAAATVDDETCIYAEGCDVCDGAGGVTDNPEIGDTCDDFDDTTINDIYTSCDVCEGETVPGCMDDTACNYDGTATVDDLSCIYAEGCDVCDGAGGVTDNPEIGDACDDGDETTLNDVYTSCGICGGTAVPGCMDDTACNFDDAATVDDETCIYAEGCDVCDGVGGITDNPEVGDTCDDFDDTTINDVYTSCGVCEGETVPGCMDDTACNFDDAATVDDETCIYAEGCDVCDGVGGITDNPEVGDACDDGDETTLNDVYTSCGICGGEAIPGCMDDTACNFDAAATVDDETCIYAEGCDACNEDGSIDDNPEVGDACDDGNDLTINDMYVACDLCTGVEPLCFDPNACNYTDIGEGDIANSELTERGLPIGNDFCVYAFGCDECSGEIDGTGTVIDNPEVGDACDDGDASTLNDVYTSCGVCEGEPCAAEPATLIPTSVTVFCNSDDVDDTFTFVTEDGLGEFELLFATTLDGTVLAALDIEPINLNSGAAGEFLIYHMYYYGSPMLVGGDNITDFEGCFALSEPIAISIVSGDDCPTIYDCPDLEANVGDECDDGNDDLFPGIINELCECEPGVEIFDCPELMVNLGDPCDDGNENTTDDVYVSCDLCEGTPSDTTPNDEPGGAIQISMDNVWGVPGWDTFQVGCATLSMQPCDDGNPVADSWYMFEAQSENQGILARANPSDPNAANVDMVIEVFDTDLVPLSGLTEGSCALSRSCFNNVGAGMIERAVPTGLTIGEFYFYRVYDANGGSSIDCNLFIDTKVKTYAPHNIVSGCETDEISVEHIWTIEDPVNLYNIPPVPVFRVRMVMLDLNGNIVSMTAGKNPTLSGGLTFGLSDFSPSVPNGSYTIHAQNEVKMHANGCVSAFWSQLGPGCTVEIGADENNQGLIGLNGLEEVIILSVYPNPNTGDQVYINMENLPNESQKVTLEIIDMFGKMMISEQYASSGSTFKQILTFENKLSGGIYFVQMSVDGKTVTQKLIIE